MVENSQSSQNSKFAMSLQYLKQELKLKLIFSMQSFQKVYFDTLSIKIARLILSLLMGMINCFQITQSNKCAISLQYLKKEVRNGDHF